MLKVKQSAVIALAAALFAGCATPPPAQVETFVEQPIDFSKRGRLVDGPEGARLVLPAGILFDFKKDELKSDATSSLDACMFIIERTTADIIVEGHTDSIGEVEYNLKLSERRAKAVRDALTARKIAPSRIEVRGLGKKVPFTLNDGKQRSQDEIDALSRRAEIIFKGVTAQSLDAPYGCGGPPEKRQVMVDAPKPEPTVFDKLREGVKSAVDKVKGS